MISKELQRLCRALLFLPLVLLLGQFLIVFNYQLAIPPYSMVIIFRGLLFEIVLRLLSFKVISAQFKSCSIFVKRLKERLLTLFRKLHLKIQVLISLGINSSTGFRTSVHLLQLKFVNFSNFQRF